MTQKLEESYYNSRILLKESKLLLHPLAPLRHHEDNEQFRAKSIKMLIYCLSCDSMQLFCWDWLVRCPQQYAYFPQLVHDNLRKPRGIPSMNDYWCKIAFSAVIYTNFHYWKINHKRMTGLIFLFLWWASTEVLWKIVFWKL